MIFTERYTENRCFDRLRVSVSTVTGIHERIDDLHMKMLENCIAWAENTLLPALAGGDGDPEKRRATEYIYRFSVDLVSETDGIVTVSYSASLRKRREGYIRKKEFTRKYRLDDGRMTKNDVNKK